MNLYSTNRISPEVDFEEALFKGLPSDNGLFMPLKIRQLPKTFWDTCVNLSFSEIAFEITNCLLGDAISKEEISRIINDSINFDAPLHQLNDNIYALELFHGTSMAFKDFGARFMAATMSFYLQKSQKKINILVATSGDTGGAVAQGFYNKSNIGVTILYPKGKVSDIQEKQLTTLGGNIKALEIEGTFDDCQALVKKAFLDDELSQKFNLASANSINIARLIPQSFYYVYAWSRLVHLNKKIVFSVPSGNFGNLTAGLIAQKMGMPNVSFIAATNVNKVVPNYLHSGDFEPISPSISTISNAMDVGNPSNFPRMLELFNNDLEAMKKMVRGCYYTDSENEKAVKEIYDKYQYLTCPHSAIGYLGLMNDKVIEKNQIGVFLSTAHYAKFLPVMESILGFSPEVPIELLSLLNKKKEATLLKNDYTDFKEFLIRNLI